jgi:hypothetical protein
MMPLQEVQDLAKNVASVCSIRRLRGCVDSSTYEIGSSVRLRADSRPREDTLLIPGDLNVRAGRDATLATLIV